MAITTTVRLGLRRWSTDADRYTREHLDTSHLNADERAAIFLSGVVSSRPTADASNVRGFFLSTDENGADGVLYYSDGVVWNQLNLPAVPSTAAVGDSISAGSVSVPARSDHVHGFPSFATGTVDVSSALTSTSLNPSRGDHVHRFSDGAIVAGTIAAGAINSSDIMTSGVVIEDTILDQSVIRTKLDASERIPTGTIFAYAGTTAPNGWMVCEGGTVSTSSTLGAMLVAAGSPYNTGGETAGTVRVPNLSNRVPRGTVSAGAHTLTVYSGSATATVTTANLPQHLHSFTADLGTSNYNTVASPVADHLHNPNFTVGTPSTAHTHGMQAHNHSLGPNEVTEASIGPKNPYAYQVWAVKNGNGVYKLPVGTGNSSAEQLVKYGLVESPVGGSWTTTQPNATNTSSQTLSHPHTVTGISASNGSHTHTLSGSTSNAGSGAAFSIVPEYVSVGYIIKL